MASAPEAESQDFSVLSPVLPYVSAIPYGLSPGRAIVIRGSVLIAAPTKRFEIDLCCGLLVDGDHQDDKALHFNPRFDKSSTWFLGPVDNKIVVNSMVNNKWGVEERYENVFKEGAAFTVRILVLAEYFKIAVNGKHLADFLYRVPIEEVKILYVAGNVIVDSIKFEGLDLPVPIDAFSGEPIRKPKLPLVISLTGGLLAVEKLSFTATPLMYATRACVNFMASTDCFFHFRIDFPLKKQKSAVVRNNFVSGFWQKEEREISHFPFVHGRTFDAIFTITLDSVLVEIDGGHFVKFVYRKDIPVEKVTRIVVEGDLAVQVLRLKKRV